MRKKSEERRQAMIDVAAQVFNEIGFEGASMAEISARIGGSKATLYNYFSSKEEIFVEVMLKQVGCQFEQAFSALNDEDDVRQGLLRLARHYLDIVLKPEVIAVKRLAMYYAGKSDLGPMLYERGPKRGWTRIAEFLKRKMDEGKLHQGDAWIAALQFRSLVESEWMDVRMLNVVTELPADQLQASAERAVEAFVYLYQPR
ncbi:MULTISPECIES: TetR/AcrR family transcriptional regulator [unclassified Herbaspirillum]|uniref:TetR/AcrR family transcriptional regulator n=1 Tax=unclassified Herbaspirillum TaxID=2624150 RepID=UPI001153F051|nr:MULTISPECIES: TetR/AcrR family transcriptional regulator [unclassified Herbaspirillum]MBB5391952.1 AcrR family transcriptional regulator [Herbaspirillum sp. SJZ102]TQK13412.1 TetR family transcriptional regulator [Herbaspirillum sp. SJZ130]TQK15416.1 TetR family transcriptional regulator [Herbaspirillum sp. SJZ106]TWC71311.1 TetR family transcriptional regulator [Herbaspirillum sp. SJZ099]